MSSSPNSVEARPTRRLVQIVLHVGFVLTGVVTPLVGPLLPNLSEKWGLDDAQSGVLFAARFLGALAGLAVFGYVSRRMSIKRLLIVGFAFTAACVLATAANNWIVCVAAIFGMGLGLSLTIPPINIYVAEANAERRTQALNFLNFAWGVGAVICSPFVAAFGKASLVAPLGVLAAMLVVAAAAIATLTIERVEQEPGQSANVGASARSIGTVLALTTALAFFYVGAEGAIGGWIGTYLLRSPGAPEAAATLGFVTFFGSLLAGRLAAALFAKNRSDERLALGCTLVAALASLAIPSGVPWPGVLLATALTGLGFSVVFPAALAIFSRHAGPAAMSSSSFIFAAANLGGASLPWLVGFLAKRYENLGIGLLVAPVACAAMLALLWRLKSLARDVSPS
jgi:MFS transporter, FHS family, glucose/mannose:H+ symporter